jgi:hypothetical protein
MRDATSPRPSCRVRVCEPMSSKWRVITVCGTPALSAYSETPRPSSVATSKNVCACCSGMVGRSWRKASTNFIALKIAALSSLSNLIADKQFPPTVSLYVNKSMTHTFRLRYDIILHNGCLLGPPGEGRQQGERSDDGKGKLLSQVGDKN